jgi:hypothetical protein
LDYLYKSTRFLWPLLLAGFFFTAEAASPNLKQTLPLIPGAELRLGEVGMPTSTRHPEARAHFLLGLKYLHNFMYPFALKEFELAGQRDPSFTLSYWGRALAYKHPLWSYEDKAKALAVLKAYQDRKAQLKATPLEQDLMSAVALLYGPATILENEKNYLKAMEKIYQQNRADPDLTSFYALALLGYASDAPYTPESEVYLQKARRLLQPLLKKYPAHPGLIHYYIHATDVSAHRYAKAGLVVVPAIYQYLTDSSHVLHMPSHLYTLFGQWSLASHANDLSLEASRRVCQFLEASQKNGPSWTAHEKRACDANNRYHSLEWLHYEYLQSGEEAKAAALLNEMKEVVQLENQQAPYSLWYERMEARSSLAQDLKDPGLEKMRPLVENNKELAGAAYTECGSLLVEGLKAIKQGRLTFLTHLEERYEAINVFLASSDVAEGFRQTCVMNQKELRAAKLFYLEHKVSAAFEELEQAMVYQEKLQISKQALGLPILPVQELYGEFALQLKQKEQLKRAAVLYENEQNYTPNRKALLWGMAHVQSALGNKAQARAWYKKLKKTVAKNRSPYYSKREL